jgi:hypothetical protein
MRGDRLRWRWSAEQEDTLTVTLRSVVRCPHCGYAREETMPLDACQIHYTCQRCGADLRPKAGDCCVYCSYGSRPCPSKQADQRTG